MRDLTLFGKGDLHQLAICQRRQTPHAAGVDEGRYWSAIYPQVAVEWQADRDPRQHRERRNNAYWASAYSGVITLAAPRTYCLSTTFNF